MSLLSAIHTKSFLLGVGISLSITYIVQKRRRRQFSPTNRPRVLSGDNCKNNETNGNVLMDSPDLDLRLIRKAEAVIQQRTSSITVVVERCTNDHNYSAILRTAEALGIQNVFIIDPPLEEKEDDDQKLSRLSAEELESRQQHKLFAKNAQEWLTIRNFQSAKECIDTCRREGLQLWVTDLSQLAVPLEPSDLEASGNWPIPSKIAVVMGTEAVGCSQEMLDGADLRVYLPLRGFADSLNLSVAAALVIHHLFLLDPTQHVAAMSEEERIALRKDWFPKLARQRLLSAADKKKRRKMLSNIQNSERMLAKKQSGHQLTASQEAKIAKLTQQRQELKALEEAANYSSTAVDEAVADLVMNPPQPLSDLRRADEHRITFAGKGVKQFHKEHWKNMAATTRFQSETMATASYFREKVKAATDGKGV